MKRTLIIAGGLLVIAAAGASFYFLKISGENSGFKTKTPSEIAKDWSQGKCRGTGTVPLTNSPIDIADLDSIAPMGNMVGDHVTPSDHLGFALKNPTALTNIYAMADGFVVQIEHTLEPTNEWYGLLIEHTCTFYSRQFLISRIAEPFREALGDKDYAAVRIPVKSGQLIGSLTRTGMDYWLADLNSKLYFANPERYNNELWKVYVTDPFSFFVEPLRTELLSRNLREAPPPGGKINYDVEGTLVGNWFKEGYIQTNDAQKDAVNTLTIAYDWLDPKIRIFSIGDFMGQAKQMAIKSTDPDPKDVGVDTGLVKYSLVPWSYRLPDGSDWNRMSLAKGKQGYTLDKFAEALVLVQLMEAHKLKLELFLGKKPEEVSGFTQNAKIYER